MFIFSFKLFWPHIDIRPNENISGTPRLELFARQKTEGWTSIGNDIDGMDIKESLDNLIAQ